MNLHLDKNAFRVLLEDVHKRTGYRADVLEKDYYVVMFLKELSDFQSEGLPAYFKGGTALYKALKMTNRFSEDIDLSVDTRGCSRTQGDKRLEKASKRYASLPRDPELGFSHRSEIMAVYEYEPVTAYDADDELQRICDAGAEKDTERTIRCLSVFCFDDYAGKNFCGQTFCCRSICESVRRRTQSI